MSTNPHRPEAIYTRYIGVTFRGLIPWKCWFVACTGARVVPKKHTASYAVRVNGRSSTLPGASYDTFGFRKRLQPKAGRRHRYATRNRPSKKL